MLKADPIRIPAGKEGSIGIINEFDPSDMGQEGLCGMKEIQATMLS